LLLRVYAGPDAVDSLLTHHTSQPQIDTKRSLLQLIEQLSKKKHCNHVYIRRKDFSLAMKRTAPDANPD
jgi:hypothetical protein